MSRRERPRKILKFLRAKEGQTEVDLFSNFQKHHFRPLLCSSTRPRLDHRRYLTLSEFLGWDPKNFHEFSEAVQRVVQEMGVWFMG
jgi:transcriptional antiterminator